MNNVSTMRRSYSSNFISKAVITILLALLAVGAYVITGTERFHDAYLNKYSAHISGKERSLDRLLTTATKAIVTDKAALPLSPESDVCQILDKESLTLLVYENGFLSYWSGNSFEAPQEIDDSDFRSSPLYLNNGWFLGERLDSAGFTMVALYRIFYDYPLENEFITNGFVDLNGSTGKELYSAEEVAGGFSVVREDGSFLFSIIVPEKQSGVIGLIIRLFTSLLLLVYIVWLLGAISRSLYQSGRIIPATLLNFGFHSLLYLIFLFTDFPGLTQAGEKLFSPAIFSLGSLIPSLGHLLIFSLLLLFSLFNLFKGWSSLSGEVEKSFSSVATTATLSILSFSGFVFLLGISRYTLLNSSISLETYNILKVNWNSLAAFISLLALTTSAWLLLLMVIRRIIKGGRSHIITFSVSLFISFLVGFVLYGSMILATLLLVLLLAGICFATIKYSLRLFNMSIAVAAALALFFLIIILKYTVQKEVENLKVLAVSYSTDHDPLAEYFLIENWSKLVNDTVIGDILRKDYFTPLDVALVGSHMDENYFNGYWTNYDIGYVVCTDESPLRLTSDEDLIDNCFSFFGDRIKESGTEITGTGFSFIENVGGRAYYLGALYFTTAAGDSNALFMELVSQATTFQAGYPELLLDKNYSRFTRLKDYSTAKYVNNLLAVRTGEFPFAEILPPENIGPEEYTVYSEKGHRHLMYLNGDTAVVISRPEIKPMDKIIGFAYLFAFILLFSTLIHIAGTESFSWAVYQANFRERLQVSFLIIIMGSFLAIGIGVSYLTVDQYRARHNRNIREKLGSVSIELDHKLTQSSSIDRGWKEGNYNSLDELLVKFSNVFYNDINLYDPDGMLLATSRPELFTRHLQGSRMDPEAFYNLSVVGASEYIHEERTGSMTYQSGYVPIINYKGDLLAYLNLPYFTLQSTLTAEVSGMIVTVANFTLLLIIITMALAVLISDRITYPLRLLREGLASIELGKKSEPLQYSGNDELSELVRQYNRLVDELEESARALSVSEREVAWREMAKQIAHEIKNPLTPMKLNVQQLNKAWKDKAPGFDEKINKFTENQIEYIDNLSAIATAFSSFARMPRANPQKLDLIEQLSKAVELYIKTENVTFETDYGNLSAAFINADKEHINGIFSNLLKNAIQAIPANRKGVIKVKLVAYRDQLRVSVSDNGSGIPDELKERLFTPNFTTKSSGMGLGLSIVKRFTETAGGTIWFESLPGNGTVFYVELPLIHTVEKL